MGLVHLPPFVGGGGETSGEQESFVFAEAGDFSQKSFHALPFFFHFSKRMAHADPSQPCRIPIYPNEGEHEKIRHVTKAKATSSL